MEKSIFLPGDVVTLKQNLPNKPKMLVVKKLTRIVNKGNEKIPVFLGIVCRWFTTEGLLQEETFNTKDLIKI